MMRLPPGTNSLGWVTEWSAVNGNKLEICKIPTVAELWNSSLVTQVRPPLQACVACCPKSVSWGLKPLPLSLGLQLWRKHWHWLQTTWPTSELSPDWNDFLEPLKNHLRGFCCQVKSYTVTMWNVSHVRSSCPFSSRTSRWAWHFLVEKWKPLHPSIAHAWLCWKPCYLPITWVCLTEKGSRIIRDTTDFQVWSSFSHFAIWQIWGISHFLTFFRISACPCGIQDGRVQCWRNGTQRAASLLAKDNNLFLYKQTGNQAYPWKPHYL